jgi:hypothetical protein
MFVKNATALEKVVFEPLAHRTVDDEGNPIYLGDGKGIDWEKVKKSPPTLSVDDYRTYPND